MQSQLEETMKYRERCDKCYSTAQDRRYARIKTPQKTHIFCNKCIYDGFMVLSGLPYLGPEEKDLLRQFRKFLSN